MMTCKGCTSLEIKSSCLNCQYCTRNPNSKQVQDCYTFFDGFRLSFDEEEEDEYK